MFRRVWKGATCILFRADGLGARIGFPWSVRREQVVRQEAKHRGIETALELRGVRGRRAVEYRIVVLLMFDQSVQEEYLQKGAVWCQKRMLINHGKLRPPGSPLVATTDLAKV